MLESSPISTFVAQADRRLLINRSLARGAESAIVGLASIVLLLIVGAQLLDWRWLAALLFCSMAFGAWRVFSRRPSPYQVSQMVDRNLGLPDTVSTAWYFLANPPAGAAETEVVALQRCSAERALADVSPQAAMPLTTPRSVMAVGLLLLAAGGLFTARYLLIGSLDLRPPVVAGLEALWRTPLGETPQPRTQLARHELPEWMQNSPVEAVVPVDENQQSLAAARTPPNASDSPLVQGQRPPNDFPPPMTTPEDAEPLEAGSEDAPSGGRESGNSESNSSSQSDNRSGDKKQDHAQSQQDSDLIKKLQDAMANLLAKMNLSDLPATTKQRDSGAKQPGEGKGGEEQGGRKQGKPGPGDTEGEGEGQPNQQGEQLAQGSDAQQSRPGESGDANSNATAQDRSGVGRQDGSKDIRDAEQKQAMGKLTELLGKRAENLKGEVTIEVSSGKQQLRTPYVSRSASHAAAGAEIRRNEIPLEYQHYVQQYFEQLRREDAAREGATAPARPPARQNP